MLLPIILLMLAAPGDANDVTRDFFGDIFRMRDCHNGSRCDNGGRRTALQVPGRPCYCQCAPSHLAYREDKQQCVKDIKECYMSVFYRPFSIEAIPLVYLPTSGQLVHPDAHLSLSMRRNFEGGLAKCRVTVSQYLTKEGWRTITKMDGTGGSVFGLYTDANKTYLQFLGNSQDRKLLQQHMVLIRLLCIIPQYPAFETCVAIRIGWVPGVENLDPPNPSNKANMMVVGLSLGVLALVYIFAVLVYLKIRRQMIAKQKANTDQEAKLQSRGDDNSDKASTLHRMEPSNRLELYHTASLGRIKQSKKGYRNNSDPWNQMSPIIETYNRTWTDRMGQHSSEFRAQDFKLQPEFFEPEFMASPPNEVLEYLERLQNSITFARHRMRSCYRYQPTLNGIPEDDYFYQELKKEDPKDKDVRTTPDGGSASSVGSIQESSDGKNDAEKRELPKIPPRKPKRKNAKNKQECHPENPQGSDQEQKEIQKAMNTLNDTLNALEYDMYKQEYLNQTSDTETTNLSCQNSTSIDFDDFETSSCSSTSAVTILGRDAKRQSDISKCSQYVEKNQSEDVSTFSNSTYSLCDAMGGLFHEGNKANNNIIESEKNNFGSRCSSRAGHVCQNDEISNAALERDHMSANIDRDISTTKQTNFKGYKHSDMHSEKHSDESNIPIERNIIAQSHEENHRKNSGNSSKECTRKHTYNSNCSEKEVRNSNTLNRKHTYFSALNQAHPVRDINTPDHQQNGKGDQVSPRALNGPHRRTNTPDKVNQLNNVNISSRENKQEYSGTPKQEKQCTSIKTLPRVENSHKSLKPMNQTANEFRNSKSPKPETIKAVNNNSSKAVDVKENSKTLRSGEITNGNPNHHENGHKNTLNPEEIKTRMNKSPRSQHYDNKEVISPNSTGTMDRTLKSPNFCNNENRHMRTSNHENIKNIKTKSPLPPNSSPQNFPLENERVHCSTPNDENGHSGNLTSFDKSQHKNIYSSDEAKLKNAVKLGQDDNHRNSYKSNLENGCVRAKTPNEDQLEMNTLKPSNRTTNKSPNLQNASVRNKTPNECHVDSLNPSNNTANHRTLNVEENEYKSSSDSESLSHTLKRSNSTESMNTIATDMTVDSLDSRCGTPSYPSPTPSLMEMWINKLVSTSVPYSKNRRKSKKKLILPEDEVDSWEHVCQKHKDPCPKHELNDSEPNLIDKLAHYSSKTMAGCDVAGYFQTLKQDVLKEHLKQWLTSNNQSKKHKKGISSEYISDCSHKKPLVNGQVNNLVDDTGMHFLNNNGSVTELKELWDKKNDTSIIEDSLESDAKRLKENGSICFCEHTDNNEQTVQN